MLSIALPLSAQVAGRLTGSAVDPNGDAVAGAAITLRVAGSTVPVLATVSTSEGLFVLPDVRPDYYDLSVVAPGFQALASPPGVGSDPGDVVVWDLGPRKEEPGSIKLPAAQGR